MFVYDWANVLSVSQHWIKSIREIVTFSFFHFMFSLEIRATYKSLDLSDLDG